MLFDVHLHSLGLTDQDLETLAYFGLKYAVVPAHAHLSDPSPTGLIEQFHRLLEVELPRLNRAGIKGYAALGIHPRALPRRGSAEILSTLPRLVRAGKVAAVGPVGLYEGDVSEVETFREQLDLAKRLHLPALVHLPVRKRESLTKKTLALLKDASLPTSRILIEGVSSQMLGTVLGLGFFASLMLHPDGMTAEQAVQLVSRFGAKGLCLSSRAGDGGSDILSLARAQHLMGRAGLSKPVIRKLCEENARRFFRAEI